jgi:hypothetical protein
MPLFKITLLFGCLVLGSNLAFATSYTVDIVANVPGCGDSVLQVGEECDGANLGGASCETIGFDAGSLSCSSACTFLTNSCVLALPGSGGGTRVVRESENTPLPETNVVVSGLAPPGMNISLLKDGQKVATVPVKGDGTFQITISGLSGGVYRMQVVGTSIGLGVSRSDVFPVQVLKDATTKISEVVLPPSLVTGKVNADYSIVGVSYPESIVSVYVKGSFVSSVVADQLGMYRLLIPISTTNPGAEVYVVAVIPSVSTSYKSISTILPVLDEGTEQLPDGGCTIPGDINADCRVDAVDFFVSRWQFVRELFSKRFDFNNDGVVDLVDFSIIAFNWTG